MTYRVLIILYRSGGYKISALDVERVLLGHPKIKDVAVIGIPNEEYGQVLAAIVVLDDLDTNLNEVGIWKVIEKLLWNMAFIPDFGLVIEQAAKVLSSKNLEANGSTSKEYHGKSEQKRISEILPAIKKSQLWIRVFIDSCKFNLVI